MAVALEALHASHALVGSSGAVLAGLVASFPAPTRFA